MWGLGCKSLASCGDRVRCHTNPGNPNLFICPKNPVNKKIKISQKIRAVKNLKFKNLWPDQQKLINNPLLKSDRANATETTTTINNSLLILCWSNHNFFSSRALLHIFPNLKHSSTSRYKSLINFIHRYNTARRSKDESKRKLRPRKDPKVMCCK